MGGEKKAFGRNYFSLRSRNLLALLPCFGGCYLKSAVSKRWEGTSLSTVQGRGIIFNTFPT